MEMVAEMCGAFRRRCKKRQQPQPQSTPSARYITKAELGELPKGLTTVTTGSGGAGTRMVEVFTPEQQSRLGVNTRGHSTQGAVGMDSTADTPSTGGHNISSVWGWRSCLDGEGMDPLETALRHGQHAIARYLETDSLRTIQEQQQTSK
jgi:hypothetical protein